MGFQKPSRRITFSLTLALALLAAAAAAHAEAFDEDSIRGYDYTGAYGQFGLSIGRIDFDGNNVDNEASGGFILGGGYRILPWLAADANFTFMGGEDNVEVGNNDFDSQYFAFTFGPKIYPLGFFDPEEIPHFIQPYGLIAIGGGEAEIDTSGPGQVEESLFVSRFILGFDIWATDHIGMFVEGGGHVTDDDDVDGVGIFTFGGQYRF